MIKGPALGEERAGLWLEGNPGLEWPGQRQRPAASTSAQPCPGKSPRCSLYCFHTSWWRRACDHLDLKPPSRCELPSPVRETARLCEASAALPRFKKPEKDLSCMSQYVACLKCSGCHEAVHRPRTRSLAQPVKPALAEVVLETQHGHTIKLLTCSFEQQQTCGQV